MSVYCLQNFQTTDIYLSFCIQDPFAQKEEYKDSPLDKFMVSYFASRMSEQLGGKVDRVSAILKEQSNILSNIFYLGVHQFAPRG